MIQSIGQIPYRQTIFTVFVLIVFGTSAIEIISEFAAGETLRSMGDDLSWFALSAGILALLIVERLIQQRALRELRAQLNKAKGQLARLDSRSIKLASQFRDILQKQFDTWNLTASEQSVTLGLLKGLTFREIAELRETREKTVRQQASGVYRKAGVSNRNELAAWFFEDMLGSPAFEER